MAYGKKFFHTHYIRKVVPLLEDEVGDCTYTTKDPVSQVGYQGQLVTGSRNRHPLHGKEKARCLPLVRMQVHSKVQPVLHLVLIVYQSVSEAGREMSTYYTDGMASPF